MRYLPDSKKGAKTQDYDRKEDGTDDLAEFPSDLVHSPLASSVESDHSRHHDLHRMAGGWGTRPLRNGYRHPLRISEIDPFLRQPVEVRRWLAVQRRRRADRVRLRREIGKMR